ncbi:hypothetical protein A6J65_007195 [Yersinia enterocolitica]|nr:hypothetical protein A6J65_007195 [Yersinia enterocolitica]
MQKYSFNIPFALEAAGVLATLTHPNHLLMYAHRDLFACCLPATPIALGIVSKNRRGLTQFAVTTGSVFFC